MGFLFVLHTVTTESGKTKLSAMRREDGVYFVRINHGGRIVDMPLSEYIEAHNLMGDAADKGAIVG